MDDSSKAGKYTPRPKVIKYKNDVVDSPARIGL
jgi:hypothetical protein